MDEHDMPKAYDPQAVEDALYRAWEESGLFNPDNLSGDPYTIMMPPPNVTGILHLGHALENSLMDIVARYHRLKGEKVLLVPGTDHAAIATQAKVEKHLMKGGMEHPRETLGRVGLVEEIRKFAEESKSTILGQIRKMGTSCDWSRLAYTFDEPRNKAVNELFHRLYEDGLIYRGYRVVNWSVKGQSTASDDEIEYVERPSKLYTFKYAKDFPITIATTRPETKLGDTAVAVHPEDERYKALIGQTFTVDVGAEAPLQIKIIADSEVDPDFGTGALGVTPAHSSVDFAMYERQKAEGNPIEIISVIGPDGRMTARAGSDYEGLGVEEARMKFVAWLKSEGLLEREEDIVQKVGTSDRYGDVIEAIPMTQWWLDVQKEIPGRGKTLRDLMKEAVTNGIGGDATKKITILPDRFTKLYLDRVDHLRDWCLSRQLWWGHRIPMWYQLSADQHDVWKQDPEAYAVTLRGLEVPMMMASEQPEGAYWVQDPDTLDTWFSSGSWTFSTLGWPDETKDLDQFHPTSFMQMGYEIIYLWLMRMILMSAYLFDDIPFKDAYIHGMVRDEHGKKFSKSSGNGFDPIEVIEKYGCDALRVSLISGISPGNDSAYYEEKIETGRNFVNKLWNISRFILGGVEHVEVVENVEAKTLADAWILGRLDEVMVGVTEKLETFQLSAAAEELRDFTWNDFADWYLEIAKIEKEKDEILLFILERLLTLWHPFIPFVTEEIWKRFHTGTFLMVHAWPTPNSELRTPNISRDMKHLQDIIIAIRNLRSENNVEAGKKVTVTLVSSESAKLLDEQKALIHGLARVESLTISSLPVKLENIVSTVIGTTEIFLSLDGLVDVDAERARLSKELKEAQVYKMSIKTKLDNDEFTSKAPTQVVEGIKATYVQTEERVQKLEEQLKRLG